MSLCWSRVPSKLQSQPGVCGRGWSIWECGVPSLGLSSAVSSDNLLWLHLIRSTWWYCALVSIIQCCSETSWSESLLAVLCSVLSQWLCISLSLSLSILSVQGLACSSPLLLAAAGLTIGILSLPHVWMCHYCWKSRELLLTGDRGRAIMR